ncbi:hypothetical protein GIB67_020321 [Kingdonia uniflora]|uniref:Uncharacterized protein n=1 Tax=Kingdonia uniflora TaxID=39325 RepID=A0A7J7NI94_9MAGN|nr:hypothetical protein GIB67_020321 [Kingdonia uniflora]
MTECVIEIVENHETNVTEDATKALAASFRKHIRPKPSSKSCIYRAPKCLREVKEEAYEPKIISFGPFHKGKKSLQAMEEHKTWYIHDFLSQSPESCLEDMIKAIKELEGDARDCYDEPIDMTSDEFVKMRNFGVHETPDGISRTPWMYGTIERDMLLLENQLPFFVLESLFNITRHPSVGSVSLSVMVLAFFQGTFSTLSSVLVNPEIKGKHHILELIHSHILSSSPEIDNEASDGLVSIPSAFDLCESGVQFKKKVTKEYSVSNITFSDEGRFEIPPLDFYPITESFIYNLIALEHCDHYYYKNWVTSYVCLLDFIINTEKDVRLLCRKEIISNNMGSDEDLALIINKLASGAYTAFYYAELCKRVNSYHRKDINRWRASLKRNYFSSPWTTASVIAAFILLVLTFLQTLFSILSY